MSAAPRRSRAGFFSSVATYALPAGEQIEPNGVRGYYIDLRVKAATPEWPPPRWPPYERRLHNASAQWGLGAYERYLAGEGETWLEGARRCASELVERQERQGPRAGGWIHHWEYHHTFLLRPPWLSAMAQGEAASLLVRLFRETGEERYAAAARAALEPLGRDAADGGVRATLDGGAFYEEYPTSPPSFVLNGAIFTLWGIHDVAVALDDTDARAMFAAGAQTLADNLHRWDTGHWSRYDLFPHPVPNVASSFYHDLHIKQLRALGALTPQQSFSATAERWARYAASPARRSLAFARKAAFRLVVPRHPTLARKLPWSRLRDPGPRTG